MSIVITILRKTCLNIAKISVWKETKMAPRGHSPGEHKWNSYILQRFSHLDFWCNARFFISVKDRRVMLSDITLLFAKCLEWVIRHEVWVFVVTSHYLNRTWQVFEITNMQKPKICEKWQNGMIEWNCSCQFYTWKLFVSGWVWRFCIQTLVWLLKYRGGWTRFQ